MYSITAQSECKTYVYAIYTRIDPRFWGTRSIKWMQNAKKYATIRDSEERSLPPINTMRRIQSEISGFF
ncbi:MAG: hypothetical protein MK212_22410, partial [Saprospiraceae bacterium]|nr:hypothetical protein [Saprospiraceae bacterium]